MRASQQTQLRLTDLQDHIEQCRAQGHALLQEMDRQRVSQKMIQQIKDDFASVSQKLELGKRNDAQIT